MSDATVPAGFQPAAGATDATVPSPGLHSDADATVPSPGLQPGPQSDTDATVPSPGFLQSDSGRFCPQCRGPAPADPCPACRAPTFDLARAATARVAEGDTLGGKYAIERALAVGGMGAVFRARHLALDQAVVVKTVRADMHDLRQLVTRFHQEARLGAQVRHPRLAQVLDYGQDAASGAPFLAMELVEGAPPRGPLPEAQVAAVLADVLAALGALHAAGVVHRDVKPANVVLAPDGAAATVIDLGISKRLADAEAASGVTGAGAAAPMSVPYAAPECFSAAAQVDARADLWSAAVMGYELLTGARPFAGDLAQLMAAILTAPLPRTGSARLDPVLQRACAKDPAARFGSAAEMAAALGAAAGAAPPPAPPAPPAGAAQDYGPKFNTPKAPRAAAFLAALRGGAPMPQLRSLYLWNLPELRDEIVDTLAAAMRRDQLPALAELNLDDDDLGDDGAARLAAEFAHCPRLASVAMQNDGLTNAGAKALVRACRGHPALRRHKLLLTGNAIKESCEVS